MFRDQSSLNLFLLLKVDIHLVLTLLFEINILYKLLNPHQKSENIIKLISNAKNLSRLKKIF